MNEEGIDIFKRGMRIELREILRIGGSLYSDTEKLALLEEVMCRIFDDLDASSYKLILSSSDNEQTRDIVGLIERLEDKSSGVFAIPPDLTVAKEIEEVARNLLPKL